MAGIVASCCGIGACFGRTFEKSLGTELVRLILTVMTKQKYLAAQCVHTMMRNFNVI